MIEKEATKVNKKANYKVHDMESEVTSDFSTSLKMGSQKNVAKSHQLQRKKFPRMKK